MASPASAPNYSLYRIAKTADVAPYTSFHSGLSCADCSVVNLQIVPAVGDSVSVRVLFWSDAAAAFIPSFGGSYGPYTTPGEFSFKANGRLAFIELTGTVTNTSIYASHCADSGFSSDGNAEHAAASLRAPLRNEILVFGVTSASVTWNIPDGSIVGQPDWRGKIINVFADGADIYFQAATTTGAVVNDAQFSTVTTVGGRSSAAPQGDEAWPILKSQWFPIPIPANALTFAVKSSAACKLRTHPAQT